MFRILFFILFSSPGVLSLETWATKWENGGKPQNESSPWNKADDLPKPPIPMNDTKNIPHVEQEALPEVTVFEDLDMDSSFEITNPDEVPEGELFEKDILLTPRQKMAMQQRKGFSSIESRWPEGSDGYPLVPYRFADDDVDQDAVNAGIAHWEEYTCIKFIETSLKTEPHLMFIKGNGCYSYIGMISSKKGQEISIGTGCTSLGTVAHEIGHAIGFYHEQSRSDRDQYLVVNTQNVEDDRLHNFDRESDNNYSVAFDYSSDMHYGMMYFSKNGLPTLATKEPLAQGLIGTRLSLSHRDKLLANKMYNCTGKWLSKCGMSEDPCQNEGYLGSDCECVCPPGTSGSLCDNKFADYYAALSNNETEKVTTEKTIMTPNHPGKYPSDTRMTKYIVAPTGKTPKVTFSAFQTSSSSVSDNGLRTCPYAFLNIRKDGDANVGQMYCEEDIKPEDIFRSNTSEMILYFYAMKGYYTGWKATVEFEAAPVVTCSVETVENTCTWKSPNFGNGVYPSNYKCIIDTPPTEPFYITYKLKTFVLQKKKCADNVTLALPYGREKVLCGKKTGKTYTSPTGSINNVFMTNEKKNYKGFEIEMVKHFDSEYYQHILLNDTISTGTLTSPSYPNKSRHQAEYWIEAPAGMKVRVSIEGKIRNSAGCIKDYLITNTYGNAMYPAESSNIYCNSKQTLTDLYSEENKFYMVFYLPRRGSYNVKYDLVNAA